MTTTRLRPGERIFRYSVPVDDQWHTFELLGNPLAVGCRSLDAVEFWARHGTAGDPGLKRSFRVYGTGHELIEGGQYWGTVQTGPAEWPLVWHLIERDRP